MIKEAEMTTARVHAIAKQLVTAFAHNDTAAYFDFFTPDASFVLYNHSSTLHSRQAYLEQWTIWQNDGFEIIDCHSSDAHIQLYDNIAIFYHKVDTKIHCDGKIQHLKERETIIFRHTSTGWLACHEHLSARE